jgi:hypothetical protein
MLAAVIADHPPELAGTDWPEGDLRCRDQQ